MTCGIYAIEHVSTARRYVGSSVHIEKRWKVHLAFLRKGKHWSKHLQGSWNKHGEEAFSFKILEKVEDPNFILPREQCCIWRSDAVRSGYNTLEIPDRLSGFRHSDDSRKRMSAAKKGKPSHRRGVPLSKEHRGALHEGRLRWKPTPDEKERLAADQRVRQTGRKYSDESRRKMSETRKKGIAEGRILLKRAVWTPEMRAALSERKRQMGVRHDPLKVSAALKLRYASNPEERHIIVERINSARALSLTPEARAKHAEAMRKKWADPEYKARVAEKISKARLGRNRAPKNAGIATDSP